jgi:hypothetical protein
VGRAALIAWLVAACGRVGFDPRSLGAAADASGVSSADGNVVTGSIVLVQQSSVVAGVGPTTVTLNPTMPGTLLVATIGENDVAVFPSGWQNVWEVGTAGECTASMDYLANNPGGITSVMFPQSSGIAIVIQITEWSGVTTLDATGQGFGTGPQTVQQVQTDTPATSDGVAITLFCEKVNNPTYTSQSSWKRLGAFKNPANAPSFMSDYNAVAAGSIAETATSSAAGVYNAVIATFR